MNASQIYIPIALGSLLVIAILYTLVSRRARASQLSPLAGLSFGLILAGLLFGDRQTFGYTLIGLGVLLAIVDMVYKLRRKN